MNPSRRRSLRRGILTAAGITLAGLSAVAGSPASATPAQPAQVRSAPSSSTADLRLPSVSHSTSGQAVEPRRMRSGCGAAMDAGDESDL